jgi:hypothetical protein
MVALTLNGSALSRLMMPSKLSFGNKQLQMFTWLVEEEYNFGMLHSSCFLHALSTTCFMLALEYLSHNLNYYQKNYTYLGFMILSWKFQLCWCFWYIYVVYDKFVCREFLMSVRGLGLKSVECIRLLTLHHLAFPVSGKKRKRKKAFQNSHKPITMKKMLLSFLSIW